MKKILFLENKDSRQQGKIDFKSFKNCESVIGEKRCNDFLEDFLENHSKFDEYDIIIIHGSIYDPQKQGNGQKHSTCLGEGGNCVTTHYSE